jgi:hypothetical protein
MKKKKNDGGLLPGFVRVTSLGKIVLLAIEFDDEYTAQVYADDLTERAEKEGFGIEFRNPEYAKA